jgi:trk system potassium uptake protein TrkH
MRQIPIALERRDTLRKGGLWKLTPPQALVLSFVALSLTGAVLLALPIATSKPTTWLQALFTSVSSSTVTGLMVVDPGTHFTLFGQSVMMVLIQLGGLGLMTFGVFIIQLSRGALSMSHRLVVAEALNQPGQADTMKMLRWLVAFTVIVELIGTLLLAIRWVPEMGWSQGLYFSLFHAIAAFNNAGVGLKANNLIDYAGDPLINVVISSLFIIGGIGFVVVADMYNKRRFRDFSLHTKLMLVGTLVINLVAMLILLVLEYGNPDTLGSLPSLSAKLWAAWFQAVSPRTAGFNTLDMADLMPASVFLIMGLMFIGAGSGSTASGIKLSTFIILVLATISIFQRREQSAVFGRSIGTQTIVKSLAITVVSWLTVVTAVFLLILSETAVFIDLAFEAVSAFGTVGLSRGITANLSPLGQGIIMVLMLIGRVGPLTLAFMLTRSHSKRIQYPDGQVSVG